MRTFLHEKLQIARDVVDNLKFERVHRIGESEDGNIRKIVCKFNMFPEREMVRRQRINLEGTPYFLHEQFPPEVIAKATTQDEGCPEGREAGMDKLRQLVY